MSLHPRHLPRPAAARRRFRRRTLQFLLLVLAIVLAALLLRIFFSFGDYAPRFYEPRDREREEMLKKKK